MSATTVLWTVLGSLAGILGTVVAAYMVGKRSGDADKRLAQRERDKAKAELAAYIEQTDRQAAAIRAQLEALRLEAVAAGSDPVTAIRLLLEGTDSPENARGQT